MTGDKMSITGVVPGRLDGATGIHDHGATGMEAATLRGVERRRHLTCKDQTTWLLALFNRGHG